MWASDASTVRRELQYQHGVGVDFNTHQVVSDLDKRDHKSRVVHTRQHLKPSTRSAMLTIRRRLHACAQPSVKLLKSNSIDCSHVNAIDSSPARSEPDVANLEPRQRCPSRL